MTRTRPVAPPTSERTATTMIDRAASGDVVRSYRDAPTRTVSAGGVEFAYRELGPRVGVPVVFLTHLAAVLDNWDPRVVDGIAAQHRVITFDNRGVGASSGSTPSTIEAMAKDAVAFIRALGIEKVDLSRLLDGRHDRPGDRRGRAAARPQAHPRRHGSRGRRRHHQRDPGRAPRHAPRAADRAGPEAVPLLHQDARRASSGQGVPGPPEGAHRAPRQGHLAQVLRRPAQGHPPLGQAAACRPLGHPPAGPRRQRRERPDGAHEQLGRPGSAPAGRRAGRVPRRRPRRHLPVPRAVRRASAGLPRR